MRNRFTLRLIGAGLAACLALPFLAGCGQKSEETGGGAYYSGQMKGKGKAGGAAPGAPGAPGAKPGAGGGG